MLYFGGKTVSLACIFLINNPCPLALFLFPHPCSDSLPYKHFRIIIIWILLTKCSWGFEPGIQNLFISVILCSSILTSWLEFSLNVNLVIWHGFHFPPLLISTDQIRIESIFIQGLVKVNTQVKNRPRHAVYVWSFHNIKSPQLHCSAFLSLSLEGTAGESRACLLTAMSLT